MRHGKFAVFRAVHQRRINKRQAHGWRRASERGDNWQADRRTKAATFQAINRLCLAKKIIIRTIIIIIIISIKWVKPSCPSARPVRTDTRFLIYIYLVVFFMHFLRFYYRNPVSCQTLSLLLLLPLLGCPSALFFIKNLA